MDAYLQKLNQAYDANPSDASLAATLIAALRRVTAGQMIVAYKYRNLPCNITSDEKLWCVVGAFHDPVSGEEGGGVLEWCYNRQDAETRLAMMQRDPRFSHLEATKWQGRVQ